MRSGRPTLKGLWQAFDETTFGMQRVFAALSVTLPVSTDREGTLQRAIRSAIDELES